MGEGSLRLYGLNVDVFSSFLSGSEHHITVNESEESVVLAHTDIQAGMMLCAALTLDDVAGFAIRPTEDFDAEAFAV